MLELMDLMIELMQLMVVVMEMGEWILLVKCTCS
jgi:hypothetical protein